MKDSKPVTIIDYHCGNLKSVEQAFKHCGANIHITSNPDEILEAEKLVLPGVGAFPVGMQHLNQLGLVKPIIQKAQSGCPILGICLGMQLLFDTSEEHGGGNGLALIKGSVRKIGVAEANFKLPNVGWCQLEVCKENALLKQSEHFYFVHSFMALPDDPKAIIAKSNYEGITFCAAVNRENIWGMQFHPENSSVSGLDAISNFVRL